MIGLAGIELAEVLQRTAQEKLEVRTLPQVTR